MITIQGKGVSKGIAKGALYFFQRPDTTVTQATVSDIEAEKARLASAQEVSIAQLNALAFSLPLWTMPTPDAEMFSLMPTSFPALKTATKPNYKF